MKARKPLSRMDCDHRRSMFLRGGRGFGVGMPSHQETCTVCPDCGEFRVYGHRNEQPFDVRFVLVTEDALTAAGQYMRLLREDERE